jgi:hypothetical protein
MSLAPLHKRLSDRELLQRLLDSKKLSDDELRQARTLYLRVIAEEIIELEPQTRAWADRLYVEYNLGGRDHRDVARRKRSDQPH